MGLVQHLDDGDDDRMKLRFGCGIFAPILQRVDIFVDALGDEHACGFHQRLGILQRGKGSANAGDGLIDEAALLRGG